MRDYDGMEHEDVDLNDLLDFDKDLDDQYDLERSMMLRDERSKDWDDADFDDDDEDYDDFEEDSFRQQEE